MKQEGISRGNSSGKETLPSSRELDIQAFSELFDVMNQSYKLYWFRGILEGVRLGESKQVFGDIINRMVSDAWYPVLGLNIKLGMADALERLIRVLRTESGLPAEADGEKVIAALKAGEEPEIRKLRLRLIQFVPYRLMSPFMKPEKWTNWDDHARTIERINTEPATLYTIEDERALNAAIQIRPAWMSYLTDHLDTIFQWTEENLIVYLQKQNPGIKDLKEKYLLSKNRTSGNMPAGTSETDVAYEGTAEKASREPAHTQIPPKALPNTGRTDKQVSEKTSKKRKTMLPKQRLWRRIRKEFCNKTLIGDISISDDEFELLVQELCSRHRRLMIQPELFEPDEIFCVALVQFGIRYYADGAYWPFIYRRINPGYFVDSHRNQFGKSFLDFMREKGKLLNEEKKAMSNILMHGFVSDAKADDLFDFLYAYYNIDLFRDINLLNGDAMNALIDSIKVKDGSKRTYNLVEHTSDAVRLNQKGCKTRLRRYLKLIDKYFWNPAETPSRSGNRLTRRFAEWWSRDEEKIERDRAAGAYISRYRGGWKPYLRYDFEKDEFSLVMPRRLVRGENEPHVYWTVQHNDECKPFEVASEAAVTGYLTEEAKLILGTAEIFDAYELCFYCDDIQQNKWKIPSDRIRFFEINGDNVEPRMLRPGEAISFSAPDYQPITEALYLTEDWKDIQRRSYHFEDGDVILFPDQKTLSIGRKPAEGLLKRGLQSGVYGISEGEQRPVYASPPFMFARILPKSMNGTQLRVNGTYYRLFEENNPRHGVLVFDLQERSAETGIHIALSQFGVSQNGLYHVELDIPNDRTNRTVDFLLINGLEYSFDEAPYIFAENGVLCVPEKTGLEAYDIIHKMEKEEGQLRFAFAMPEEDPFFRLSLEGIPIAFEIPKLSYRFEGEDKWRTQQMLSAWHKDIPKIVEIRYPAEKLTLLLDKEGNEEENVDQYAQNYTYNHERGCFVCDLHPFDSWYGKRVAVRRLYVQMAGMKKPERFLNIYIRDVLVSAILSADPERDLIQGEFDIVGKTPCAADLWFEDRLLLEKEPIVDGKISCPTEVLSGRYRVDIYELDADENGFDEETYEFLTSRTMELVNPANLTGKHIEIQQLMRNDSENYLRLKRRYFLYDLKPMKERGKGFYSGHMVVREKVSGEYREDYPACLYIPNREELSKGHLFRLDEYGDQEDFIYDNDRHFIRTEEDKSLTSVSRYRRFLYLLDDLYQYRISFVEKPADMDSRLENERAERALVKQGRIHEQEHRELLRKMDPLCKPISKIGLPIAIINELLYAGIIYTTDLRNMTINDLSKIKGLNRADIEQCIIYLRKAGYKVSML